MITVEQLLEVAPQADPAWARRLTTVMDVYSINTQARVAAFIAQCAHESSGFTKLEENLNYSAQRLLEVFPTHFDAAESFDFAHQPEKIANRVYANRMGNGNEASGDGWKYRGRGIIQTTGAYGYGATTRGIGVNVLVEPELLCVPSYAACAAAWEFMQRGCNVLADEDDFAGITKAINGGYNGLANRQALYDRAMVAIA